MFRPLRDLYHCLAVLALERVEAGVGSEPESRQRGTEAFTACYQAGNASAEGKSPIPRLRSVERCEDANERPENVRGQFVVELRVVEDVLRDSEPSPMITRILLAVFPHEVPLERRLRLVGLFEGVWITGIEVVKLLIADFDQARPNGFYEAEFVGSSK
jgi:hypothetical protein